MKLEVIIEKNDNMLWGRVEDKGNFLPATGAKNTRQVLDNLKMLIKDYQSHEGKEDKFWKIAKRAGLNPALVRHYAAGIKHPSVMQAKKLEEAIRCIAEDLGKVRVYAG